MPRYPFSPAVLDALPEELAELFRALELTLLEEICSRLKAAGQLNEVTVQDIRALRAHGIDLGDIQRAIAQATGTGMDELEALLDDVVARNQAYYTSLINLAQVTAPETLLGHEDIWAIYEQTRGQYRNITRSMGFLVRQGGRPAMLDPARAYQWALDQAALQVQSGAISYGQAISEAIRQLADSGLRTVSYDSGHVDSVDVAVRRAVMTGVNQLNQRYREQSMDYLETDLVEVTAHLGARNVDGPNGWENHAKWQGKVYRWRRNGNRAYETAGLPEQRERPEGLDSLPNTLPKTPALLANTESSGILSEEDVYAIDQYKSSNVAYPLNSILRGEAPMTEGYQQITLDIDRALEKLPTYQGTVYRSLRSQDMVDVSAFWERYTPGKIVREHAYTSTGTVVYDETMDIQMIIQSKSGRDMRIYNPSEHEVLFQRGAKFIVEKREGDTLWLTEI